VCLHSEEIKGDHAYKTRYSNEVEMIVAQEYLYETQPTVESYELADASLPKLIKHVSTFKKSGEFRC